MGKESSPKTPPEEQAKHEKAREFLRKLIDDEIHTVINRDISRSAKIYADAVSSVEHKANTDTLTEIPNRRAAEDELIRRHKMIGDAIEGTLESNAKEFGMLMIDADHFKDINDKYGHPFGDIVLKRIADILQHNIRPGRDFVARWGGEEFLVLVENQNGSIEGILNVAERIRSAIDQTKIYFPNEDGGATVPVTISIGASPYFIYDTKAMDGNYDSKDDSMHQYADRALYDAKTSGRNRIFYYDPKSSDTVFYKASPSE